jgi:pSer/pThr/pTyr-binding forkhead associated (FHA) protein
VYLKSEEHAVPPPIPAVRVRIEKGNGRPQQQRFRQNFTLGRGDDCDLRFHDTQVSLRHARFVWDGSRWFVEDLQSTNGTYLNGMRIQRAALPPQATLELVQGGPVIAYDIEQPEQPVAASFRRQILRSTSSPSDIWAPPFLRKPASKR